MTTSAEPEPVQLDHSTLGRQIADVVRREILFGKLPAGTKLGQQRLCDRFGVSRMPVRDALRQLMHEGLVNPDGGRNSIVAHVGRRDIEDSFLIEGMLHGMAVRRVTEKMTDEWRDELRARNAELTGCRNQPVRFAELDWGFHSRINRMADSRKLTAALRALARSIPHEYVAEHPEWVHRVDDEHVVILEAMLQGKADRADELTQAHIVGSGNDLIAFLQENGVALS